MHIIYCILIHQYLLQLGLLLLRRLKHGLNLFTVVQGHAPGLRLLGQGIHPHHIGLQKAILVSHAVLNQVVELLHLDLDNYLVNIWLAFAWLLPFAGSVRALNLVLESLR